MMNTYVIADLHGRRDLLDRALSTILLRPPGRIVTLGDYVDRGPDSRGVVVRLMDLSENPPDGWKVTCLKGNHEAMMVSALMGKDADMWITNGGEETLLSYGHQKVRDQIHPRVVPVSHIRWMDRLPDILWDDNRVFVHAAVDETKPIAVQTIATKLWARYNRGWPHGHDKRFVVHGHDADPDGPLVFSGRLALDTAAWHTGRLVVAVFNDMIEGGPTELIEIVSSGAEVRQEVAG